MPNFYIFCCVAIASLLIALSSHGGFLSPRVESVSPLLSDEDQERLANAGGLDPTFNQTGEKEIPVSPTGGSAPSHDQVNGIAVQSDAKIVLTGYVRANINDTSSPEQVGVVRLNADGSPDTGFGNSGIVITQAATATINPNSRGQAVAIQADGKIVVAGMANASTLLSQQDFALVRYNVNGSLDTTFGSGGKVTGTFTSSGFTTPTAAASSLLIQPDGKIVAGGMAQNVPTGTDFALARYNSDGSLDTTFGTGGKVTTDFGSIAEQSTGIAFLTDQGQLKIVAVGAVAGGATNHNFGVARYNANGTLDSTFGTGGKVVTSVDPSGADASSVAVASDGTIVVAGAGPNFTLARYDVHGALVPSFGSGGIVIRTMPGGAFPDAIAIQPDAKIIVSGSYGGFFGLERYAANGTLDSSFGTATIGPSDQVCIPSPCTPPITGANSFAMVLEPSTGKIIIAGDSGVSGNHQTFAVARLLNDAAVPTPTPTPTPTPAPSPTPTPSLVTVSGRALTSNSAGLRNATITMTDSQNVVRTATTSSFGLFSFSNVTTGGQYVFRVLSRSFRYSPQTVTVNGDMTLPDFVGLE